MFKTLSLFALALLLVAAVAAPIDLSNVASVADSTADSLKTDELLSQDEDSDEYGEDSDDDDDSVLNGSSPLGPQRDLANWHLNAFHLTLSTHLQMFRSSLTTRTSSSKASCTETSAASGIRSVTARFAVGRSMLLIILTLISINIMF
jgi:hypothetical protein